MTNVVMPGADMGAFGPHKFGSGRESGLPCMPQHLDRVSQENIYTNLIDKETDYMRSVHYEIGMFPKEKSGTGRFEFVRHPSYVKVVWKGAPPGTPAPAQTAPELPGAVTKEVLEREQVVQIAEPAQAEPAPPAGVPAGKPTPPGSRQEPPLPKEPAPKKKIAPAVRNDWSSRLERQGKLQKMPRGERLVLDKAPRESPLSHPSARVDRLLLTDGEEAESVLESALDPARPGPPGQLTQKDKLLPSASAPNLPGLHSGQMGLTGRSLRDPRAPPSDDGSPRPVPKPKAAPVKKFRGLGMPKAKNAGDIAVPKHLVDQVDMQQLDRHWSEFKPDRSTKLSRKHPPVWHTMMMPGTR